MMGYSPVCFKRLVMQDLLLDAAALVHGFHGAEHAPAFGEAVEFQPSRLLRPGR